MLDGHKIVLVDTPGFDDDSRSDVQILHTIVAWLSERSERQEKQLDGLILLQPVTANRIGGTERRRTKLLQDILGKDAYKRVIIATTMWDDLRNEDNKFDYRINGRMEKGEVWYDMCSNGAVVVRHTNTKGSAHNIIRTIITKSMKEKGGIQLQLQRELMAYGGAIAQTAVGRSVNYQLRASIGILKGELLELETAVPEDTAERSLWKKERADLRKAIRQREDELSHLEALKVVGNAKLLLPLPLLGLVDTFFYVRPCGGSRASRRPPSDDCAE